MKKQDAVKKEQIKLAVAGVLSGLALLTSACGGSPYAPLNNYQYPGSYPGGTGGTTIETTPAPNPDGFPPAYRYEFTTVGSNTYTTPSASTDNLLKIRITAQPAGGQSVPTGGSGYVANYGCVRYSVNVKSASTGTSFFSQQTQVLNAGIGSPFCGSATSEIITVPLNQGHPNPVKVTVKAEGYDFYCIACYTYPSLFNAYVYGCSNYCPTRPIYTNHGIRGVVEVQVNNTYLP